MKVSWHKVRNLRELVLFCLLIALSPNKGGNIITNTWRHGDMISRCSHEFSQSLMSEKGILGVYKSQLKEDEKKYKGEFHVFFNYLHLSANYGK